MYNSLNSKAVSTLLIAIIIGLAPITRGFAAPANKGSSCGHDHDHGSDREEALAHLFDTLAANSFLLSELSDSDRATEDDPYDPSSLFGPEDSNKTAKILPPYVQLPTGESVPLDSKFFALMHRLVASAAFPSSDQGEGCTHESPDKVTRAQTPSRLGRLGRFGLNLYVDAQEIRIRYGLIAALIWTAGEGLETATGLHVLCTLVGAAAAVTGAYSNELLMTCKARYPQETNPVTRTMTGLQIFKARWTYWRAMDYLFTPTENRLPHIEHKKFYKAFQSRGSELDRIIYRTPYWSVLLHANGESSCSTFHAVGDDQPSGLEILKDICQDDSPFPSFYEPLAPETPQLQRFFSAQHQLALLYLILNTSRGKIAHYALGDGNTKWLQFIKLRNKSAAMAGKALDMYAATLRQMAFTETNVNNRAAREDFVRIFIYNFFTYLTNLAIDLDNLNQQGLGQLNPDSPVFTLPAKMIKFVKAYQKSGTMSCESDLESVSLADLPTQ